jgi:hypothetical protein
VPSAVAFVPDGPTTFTLLASSRSFRSFPANDSTLYGTWDKIIRLLACSGENGVMMQEPIVVAVVSVAIVLFTYGLLSRRARRRR